MQVQRFSSIKSSSSTKSGVARPQLGSLQQQQQHHQQQRRGQLRTRAIEEKRDTSGADTAKQASELLTSDEAQRIAELRRATRAAPAPPKSSGNLVQGALDEAQLISWPKPGKALLDTLLVLAIVAGTGAALFGVNVALTDAFNWWYSSH